MNPQALAERICWTIGGKRVPCAEWIVDAVGAESVTIPAIWIGNRLGVIRVAAKLPSIVALAIIETWSVGRIGIVGGFAAVRTAVSTVFIAHAIR